MKNYNVEIKINEFNKGDLEITCNNIRDYLKNLECKFLIFPKIILKTNNPAVEVFFEEYFKFFYANELVIIRCE